MSDLPSNLAAKLPLQPRDFLILLALADGERHGYGLIQDLEELSDQQIRIDPANLYRSLRRLARDGLVSDMGRRPTNSEGERRRYYAITAGGRQLASAEAQRLHRLTSIARSRRLIAEPEGST